MGDVSLELVAYGTRLEVPRIVPAPPTRAWMDAVTGRYVYKCLSMVVANQAGWFVLNPHALEVTWNGLPDQDALQKRQLTPGTPCIAESHFGHGILTWRIPFLFRTPPEFDLLVRGPANSPKADVCALEGLVETDWSIATFTMNWKLTRPHTVVHFAQDEPISMLVPQRKHDLERFAPSAGPLESNPDLAQRYRAWQEDRDRDKQETIERFQQGQIKTEFQRHYFKGTFADGTTAPEHRIRLVLKDFADRNAA